MTSITSNGLSSSLFAISAIICGSEPKSCTAIGFSASVTRRSASVFLLLYKIAFALTISVYKSPQPISRHKSLNGKSVTPAIGARNTLFSILTFPIFIVRPRRGKILCKTFRVIQAALFFRTASSL